MPHVRKQCVDRLPLNRSIQPVNSLSCREISFHRRDRGAQAAEFSGGLMDGRLVGCDNEVKSLPDAAFGKLISNARRAPVTIARGREDDMAAS